MLFTTSSTSSTILNTQCQGIATVNFKTWFLYFFIYLYNHKHKIIIVGGTSLNHVIQNLLQFRLLGMAMKMYLAYQSSALLKFKKVKHFKYYFKLNDFV